MHAVGSDLVVIYFGLRILGSLYVQGFVWFGAGVGWVLGVWVWVCGCCGSAVDLLVGFVDLGLR